MASTLPTAGGGPTYRSWVLADSRMAMRQGSKAENTMTIAAHTLEQKIRSRTARTGVVGLGYVGLPLAVELAECGFETIGIDLDSRRSSAIEAGRSYIPDVPDAKVAALREAGRLRATTDFSVMGELDTVNICVPTPLRKTKDPDMSYVVSAVEQIALYLHPQMLVVLESTTYPGTTEELVQPMLEASGLKAGVDFFLAFSPERVDPGQPHLPHTQRSEGGRRDHPARARESRRRCTKRPSTPSCRSARRASPRWSSCWRTRSARSTSAWSTSWR